MNLKTILFSVMFLVWFSDAAGEEIQCPDTISVKQEVVSPISGWETVAQQSNATLDQVAIYFHHPKEKGSQVPDSVKKIKGHEHVTWKLTGNSDQYWVGCVYHDTTVIQAKKLNAGVKRCIADYTLLASGARLKLNTVRCE